MAKGAVPKCNSGKKGDKRENGGIVSSSPPSSRKSDQTTAPATAPYRLDYYQGFIFLEIIISSVEQQQFYSCTT